MEVGFKEISAKMEKMKTVQIQEKEQMVSKLRKFIYEHKEEVVDALKGNKPFNFSINKSNIFPSHIMFFSVYHPICITFVTWT